MGWTDERVERAKALWIAGKSASEIARDLGGLTRNAVIGKIHRLGLSGREAPSRPERRLKPVATRVTRNRIMVAVKAPPCQPVPKIVVVSLKKPAALAPIGGKATIELAAGDCRFPVGDATGMDQRHCGGEAEEGDSYCAHHRKLAGGKRSPVSDAPINLPRWARS